MSCLKFLTKFWKKLYNEIEKTSPEEYPPFHGAIMGAGIAVGLSAIAAGIAEKEIGAAAIGAMAEKEELFGKGLILTVIPETLVIFGLVVAILILGLAG